MSDFPFGKVRGGCSTCGRGILPFNFQFLLTFSGCEVTAIASLFKNEVIQTKWTQVVNKLSGIDAFHLNWSRVENVFLVRHNSIRMQHRLTSGNNFIPLIDYLLYKKLLPFKASRYSTPQEGRSSWSEQIPTINTTAAIFMSHCEYSDVMLIVDWILFVLAWVHTSGFSNVSNFSNNLIKKGCVTMTCATLSN